MLNMPWRACWSVSLIQVNQGMLGHNLFYSLSVRVWVGGVINSRFFNKEIYWETSL